MDRKVSAMSQECFARRLVFDSRNVTPPQRSRRSNRAFASMLYMAISGAIASAVFALALNLLFPSPSRTGRELTRNDVTCQGPNIYTIKPGTYLTLNAEKLTEWCNTHKE